MEIMEPFGKCTIVAVKLQNGFIITESNVCLDPESYNKELGIQICVERIKNRIWELESYKQQSLLAE
ncbi:Gp49 family protein [Neobacillus pocheonensis]|uniref:Gp49 family protein n=1 Tax=Neobacillus pocheonensis TaxID=363869 RepID=A0ABT0WDD5_9BACI|nr:Gp49 family protein [Neobacillus pocheonensis]